VDSEDNVAQVETEFLARGRARVPLGSIPTVTGIFGLTAAQVALRILLGTSWPDTAVG
jgi:hypothetical protein